MVGRLLVVVAVLGAGSEGQPAPGGADRAAYEAAERQAGRDAGAQVRLALWCEAHGMNSERMKHLAAAVLDDPSNALARGLMGLVAFNGKWQRPEEVTRDAADDAKRKALLEEYFQRRTRAADRPDEQWTLALWCEQSGLKDQAVAHFHAVLRLDPRREAAWKRLGFKKVGGGWVKPELLAAARREADEQERANRHWRPILERWRSGLASRDKQRRADAEAGLLQVTEARAVPMVWAVFVTRGADGQKVGVRVLAQIDSPGSSRALALLALVSKSAEARGEAVQILRQRDPRDFAPLLVAMIRDPIKYDVKAVSGPGKPGELVIEDGTTKRKRLYSPPPTPNIPLSPNDYYSLDASGLPTITRVLGLYQTPVFTGTNSEAQALAMFGLKRTTPDEAAARLLAAGMPAAISQKLGTEWSNELNSRTNIPGNPQYMIRGSVAYQEALQIPIGQMILDSQRAAEAAQMQLAGDVQAIEAYNAPIREVNRCVRQVLTGATGNDLGDDRSAWSRWLVDLFGYVYAPQKASADETTIVEQVPLAYQPQAVPIISDQIVGLQLEHRHSCFGAGTPVRTIDGLRPIESLRAGDLVLTQHPSDGELKYQAVVTVYHNPPNATYRVKLDHGDPIVATGIHRLWRAGKGWTMVRELRPGDVLRTLGGVAAVTSVEADRTQPVYNLQAADGESYFVGAAGVLAHDNSTIHPVPEPFDAIGPPTIKSSPAAKPRSMLGR
jgi:hypothetical protein